MIDSAVEEMNKRYLAYGIIILLLGVAASYESGQQFLSNLSNPDNTRTSEFGLAANSVAYVNATVPTQSFFSAVYNATEPTNFYLVNSSAFLALSPYFNSTTNLSAQARALEGRGVFDIEEGPASGAFPYQPSYAQYIPAPNYTETNATTGTSSFLPNDTYYLVFRNLGPGNSTMVYSYYIKSAASVSLTGSSSFSFGMLGGIMLVGGLALMAFSFFRRSGQGGQTAKSEEIGKAYDQIEAESRPLHARKARRARPGRRRHATRSARGS